MSDYFTYEKPDDTKYHQSLIKYLQMTNESELLDIVRRAKCSISPSNTFSKQRWNAKRTEIIFYVSAEVLKQIDEMLKYRLAAFCDKVMPKEIGFDVMSVDFVPGMEGDLDVKTLEDDLVEIKRDLSNIGSNFSLPEDILDKGHQMAEIYLYLYAVENYIRIFIEKVGKEKYQDEFFDKLNIPKRVKDSIAVRRRQEAKNQWISIRGDSELFYLDFKELGAIIINNWNLFKKYFPDQSWISSKIEELGDCRNLVAHNSYIGSHERDVIRVNEIIQ